MHPRPSSLISIAFIATTVVACVGASDATSRGAEITDSAGVRIVHNMAARFEHEGTRWHVSAEPAVTIGEVAGDEAYLFDRIMSVERLSDGRWAVADMGSSQVRFFDANGGHLHSVGRAGDGPGEFRQIMGMMRLAGDTLVVDDGRMRLHVLDGNGALVGIIPSDGSFVSPRTIPAGVFADGSLVARTMSASPQRLTEPHSMTLSISRLELSPPDNGTITMVLDTIGTWDLLRLVPGWRGGAQRIQFDGTTHIALLSNGIAVADPMSNEVRLYDANASLRTIVRRERQPVPVTQEHIDAARDRFINMQGEGGGPVPQRMLEQRAAIADVWVVSEHMPAFSAMIIDDADNIWLRDYVINEETVGTWGAAPVQPTQWTVLDSDGILLGNVELPARFLPRDIFETAVSGVYRDEADVEYVHVYELTRG